MTEDEFIEMLDFNDVPNPIIVTSKSHREVELGSKIEDYHGREAAKGMSFIGTWEVGSLVGVTSDRLFVDPIVTPEDLRKLTDEQKKIWALYFGPSTIAETLQLDRNEEFEKLLRPAKIERGLSPMQKMLLAIGLLLVAVSVFTALVVAL